MTGSAAQRSAAPHVIQAALDERMRARANPEVANPSPSQGPSNEARHPRKRGRAATKAVAEPPAKKPKLTAAQTKIQKLARQGELADALSHVEIHPEVSVVPALGRIPLVKGSQLPNPFPVQTKGRSEAKLIERHRSGYKKRAEGWAKACTGENATVVPIRYQDLLDRADGKQDPVDLQNAKKIMARLQTKPCNPWSRQYVTEDEPPVVLLSCLASRPKDPTCPQPMAMDCAEHWDYMNSKGLENFCHDGYQDELLTNVEAATQCLAAICEPNPATADCRHQIVPGSTRHHAYCGTPKDTHFLYQSDKPPPTVARIAGAEFFIREHARQVQLEAEKEHAQIAELQDKRNQESVNHKTEPVVKDEPTSSSVNDVITLLEQLKVVKDDAITLPSADELNGVNSFAPRDGMLTVEDGYKPPPDNLPLPTFPPQQFDKKYDVPEQAGIFHLCEAWQSQGHNGLKNALYPSHDTRGQTATKGMAVRWYLKATALQHIALDEMVKAAHPEEWAEFRKTYKSAIWVGRETYDAGCFLGEAVIWKLQIDIHRDVQDTGFCVCVATGHYTGGRAVFTDIPVVLNYKRGDVLIFRSMLLYHGIEDWTTDWDVDLIGLTPGRVSHTFFNPATAIALLQSQKNGWSNQTASGMAPGNSGYKKPT